MALNDLAPGIGVTSTGIHGPFQCGPPDGEQPQEEILRILELETLETNLFRGGHGRGTHVFGGQVLAQALIAASATLNDDFAMHSMHGYFLRRGDYRVPIVFDVDRIRDGRSFATRRVRAMQGGKAIFNLASSFQRAESGFEHADAMPRVPPPDGLENRYQQFIDKLGSEQAVLEHRYAYKFSIFDVRDVPVADPATGISLSWIRCTGDLPGNRVIRAAVLAYMSDLDFLDVALMRHIPPEMAFDDAVGHSVMCVSLDHAIWFHRPFNPCEWLLFDKESTRAAGARGLLRGRFFTTDGTLVASVAQECLIRPITNKTQSGEAA